MSHSESLEQLQKENPISIPTLAASFACLVSNWLQDLAYELLCMWLHNKDLKEWGEQLRNCHSSWHRILIIVFCSVAIVFFISYILYLALSHVTPSQFWEVDVTERGERETYLSKATSELQSLVDLHGHLPQANPRISDIVYWLLCVCYDASFLSWILGVARELINEWMNEIIKSSIASTSHLVSFLICYRFPRVKKAKQSAHTQPLCVELRSCPISCIHNPRPVWDPIHLGE